MSSDRKSSDADIPGREGASRSRNLKELAPTVQVTHSSGFVWDRDQVRSIERVLKFRIGRRVLSEAEFQRWNERDQRRANPEDRAKAEKKRIKEQTSHLRVSE